MSLKKEVEEEVISYSIQFSPSTREQGERRKSLSSSLTGRGTGGGRGRVGAVEFDFEMEGGKVEYTEFRSPPPPPIFQSSQGGSLAINVLKMESRIPDSEPC